MRRMNEKHLLFHATARQKMPHPQLFFLLVLRKICSDFLKWFPLFLHPVRDLYNLSIFHPMFQHN